MSKTDNVVKYLNGYHRAFNQWVYCSEQIRLLREKQMATASPNLSGMPRANGAIDLSDYIVRLEMQIQECQSKRAKATEEMRKVKNAIVEVFDETDRKILNYRYLDFMSFTEIAELMNMSKSTVARRHETACERLYRKIM